MKAISVHAPWAWALMFGGKDVENRSGNFPRNFGGDNWGTGRVWVHASLWPGGQKPLGDAGRENMYLEFLSVRDVLERCPKSKASAMAGPVVSVASLDAMRGHIIGNIEVHGFRTPDDPPDSPWYVPGSLAIMVRDPRPLAVPVPAKGALGWWAPTAEVMARLEGAR